LVLAAVRRRPSALLLQLAAIYLPPLRDLLHTQPLALTDLLIVGAASTLGYAAIRLDRIIHPAKRTLKEPPTHEHAYQAGHIGR
jgi:Ca2+-transporting ATPase